DLHTARHRLLAAGHPVAYRSEGPRQSAAHGVDAEHVPGGQPGDLLHDPVGDGGTATGGGVTTAAPGCLTFARGGLHEVLLRVGGPYRAVTGHVGHRRMSLRSSSFDHRMRGCR